MIEFNLILSAMQPGLGRISSIAMMAAAVFFLMASTCVGYQRKTSTNSGALATLAAAVHYSCMCEFWAQIGASPTVYRCIDWTITMPRQMIEFSLILSAM